MTTAYTTMRITLETRDILASLAKKEGRTIGGEILDLARRRERELRWAEIGQAYDRLRQNPRAWEDYRAEADLIDQASGDGLENEPPYPLEGLKYSARSGRGGK